MFQHQSKIIAFLQLSSQEKSLFGCILIKFLRYFPKYVHKLEVGVQTASRVISKVKCIKILHAFQGYQSHFLRRTLLYNKERHLQAIIYEDWERFQYSKSFLKEIQAFTGLQALKLPFIETHPLVDKTENLYYLKKTCQSLKILHLLENLEFEISCKEYLATISRIHNWQKLLSSLKTFKINYFSDLGVDPNLSDFKALLNSKDLLKYITHLKLGCLEGPSFYKVFEDILACCSKLVSLCWKIARVYPAHMNDVQCFSNFTSFNQPSNCQHLLWRESRFFDDFILPPFIESVKLNFLYFTIFNDFESDENFSQRFLTFCEKWSHLTNLHTLQILFSTCKYIQPLNFQFPRHWLKKIQNVRDLSLQLSSTIYIKNQWFTNSTQEGFDLSIIFESIKHLKSTLQSLSISDLRHFYYLKNLPTQSFGLERLEKFLLQGLMSPEFGIEKLFKTNLGDLIGNHTEKPLKLWEKDWTLKPETLYWNLLKSFIKRDFGTEPWSWRLEPG